MPSKPPGDHFTVLYFASAATFTKKSSEHLPAPLKASKLFETLEARYPGITHSVLSSSALTVNLDYVDIEEDADGDPASSTPTVVIKAGDEVAIIPPVSSG